MIRNNAEVTKEEETFKGMCLIKKSDMLHYGPLLEELHNYSDVGRDEYPNSKSGIFSLLTRRSGQIQYIS